VYYLIFDRYAGEQTLREDFGFDDGAFYSMLRSDGFYVAQQSLANYPKTTHSLASSLNMTYLDGLAERIGHDSGDWDPLTDSLDRSLVASTFQRIGYRYEHIGSWWPPTAADPSADENVVYGRAETFGQLVWETTAFPAVARTFGLDDDASFERGQYRRVAFQISALERIARDPAATFTFAHFTLPHPPYVFDAEGRFLSPERVSTLTEDEAYLGQLRYANTQIAALLDTLLSGPSDEDPIIVLQSDEGPHPAALTADEDGYVWTQASDRDLGEKLRILNAYYLPGPARDALYQQISPVNSFRLILDRYFGADLPLLPDRTYVFERTAFPYRFTDVTARLRATATTPAGA